MIRRIIVSYLAAGWPTDSIHVSKRRRDQRASRGGPESGIPACRTRPTRRMRRPSVIGSAGETWTSMDSRRRLTANDAASPMARPIPKGSIPCVEHEFENIVRRCANRHPNSNLLRALAHRMRDDAIQADRSQQQRDRGENQEHRSIEPAVPKPLHTFCYGHGAI